MSTAAPCSPASDDKLQAPAPLCLCRAAVYDCVAAVFPVHFFIEASCFRADDTQRCRDAAGRP